MASTVRCTTASVSDCICGNSCPADRRRMDLEMPLEPPPVDHQFDVRHHAAGIVGQWRDMSDSQREEIPQRFVTVLIFRDSGFLITCRVDLMRKGNNAWLRYPKKNASSQP